MSSRIGQITRDDRPLRPAISNLKSIRRAVLGGSAIPASLVFLLVAAAGWLAPAIIPLAEHYWTTTQGAQGPIILAIGLWAAVRLFRRNRALARPGNPVVAVAIILCAIGLAIFARLIGMLPLQMIAALAGIVATLYGLAGGRMLQRLWMPLALLLAAVPLPYFAEQALTATLKLKIAAWSVDAVAALGLEVANSGNALYVDQYELMIDAACSGLNSIVSLSVVGLFYICWRYRGDRLVTLLLAALVVPIAILCNFARVCLILVLVHFFGDRLLATVLHPAMGVVMFLIALGCIVGLDRSLRPGVR